MTGLAAIVAALKTQIDTIDGLKVWDYVPDSSMFPGAIVVPPDIDYRQTFALGYTKLELEVVVLVATASDRMQKDLFAYLDWSGASSIAAVVDANKTLGLTGVDAVAMSSRPLGLEEIASYNAYGAAVRFQIGCTTTA